MKNLLDDLRKYTKSVIKPIIGIDISTMIPNVIIVVGFSVKIFSNGILGLLTSFKLIIKSPVKIITTDIKSPILKIFDNIFSIFMMIT
jgi:hypothetical protein